MKWLTHKSQVDEVPDCIMVTKEVVCGNQSSLDTIESTQPPAIQTNEINMAINNCTGGEGTNPLVRPTDEVPGAGASCKSAI